MQFNIPESTGSIIKVIGVGGGGSNAVNYMFEQGIVGVDFAICNTDNQAMEISPVPVKIQLGPALTEGRGAGSKPTIGREACIESLDEVRKFFANGTKMLFVTAGMGGGTGTGAAPVIAKTAREMDILTVGIVTMPFTFEGRRRIKQALEGIAEMKKSVDTLIVISNDKLRKMYGSFALGEAFSRADDILTMAAKGIAEIITVPGYVNVDFEDVNTVMRDSGVAVMGTAAAEGENRALNAVEMALRSPLLEDDDIKGAQHILLNITSGTKEVTMDEVFEITEYVQQAAGKGTDLIWGNCHNEELGEKIAVTIIATGFETANSKIKQQQDSLRPQEKESAKPPVEPVVQKRYVSLDDEEEALAKKKEFSKYSIDPQESEPYVEKQQPVKQPTYDSLEERRQRIKNLSGKLNNPEVVNELENMPAYLRKGLNLEHVPPASESHLSKYSLSDDDEPEVRDKNAFLHDNVD